MSYSLIAAKELLNSYRDWLIKNPEKASDFETAFKWISYFVAGRINNSHILTEGVYAASNLLVLFNDRIVSSLEESTEGCKLKVWLTVLEYSEVFVEISASKLWGARGKWIIVAALQILKCAVRLVLLLKHKLQLVPSPAVTPLQRPVHLNNPSNIGTTTVNSVSFTLKRSGRVIRKVESAPPTGFRLWRPPTSNGDLNRNDEDNEELLRRRLIAEIIYIIKPLVHLVSSYKFGATSWKPWLLSLGMDLSSLYILKNGRGKALNEKEQLELSRRSLMLLFYLLRSPFYERHSENRMSSLLDTLSRRIPLARYVCGPVQEYIPYWRATYSYSWST